MVAAATSYPPRPAPLPGTSPNGETQMTNASEETKVVAGMILPLDCNPVIEIVIPSIHGDPRPAYCPDSFPVFNAHRPLYGQITLQQRGTYGRHFAAVDPDAYGFASFCARNVQNDARLVVTRTEEQIMAWATAHFVARYGEEIDGDSTAEMVKEMGLDYALPLYLDRATDEEKTA